MRLDGGTVDSVATSQLHSAGLDSEHRLLSLRCFSLFTCIVPGFSGLSHCPKACMVAVFSPSPPPNLTIKLAVLIRLMHA